MKTTKPILFLVLSVLLMNYKTILASNVVPNIGIESVDFDTATSEYTVTGPFFGDKSYKVKLSSSKGRSVRSLDLAWFKVLIASHPTMEELNTSSYYTRYIDKKRKVIPNFKMIKQFESYHKANEVSITVE